MTKCVRKFQTENLSNFFGMQDKTKLYNKKNMWPTKCGQVYICNLRIIFLNKQCHIMLYIIAFVCILKKIAWDEWKKSRVYTIYVVYGTMQLKRSEYLLPMHVLFLSLKR